MTLYMVIFLVFHTIYYNAVNIIQCFQRLKANPKLKIQTTGLEGMLISAGTYEDGQST